MKNRAEITVEDLMAWADNQDPTRSNPTNAEGDCRYVGYNGTHCIAGQFLFDHGATDEELSANEGSVADYVADWLGFTDPALQEALTRIQEIADFSTDAHSVNPWGNAIDYLYKLTS